MSTCGGDTGTSFGPFVEFKTMFNVTRCNSLFSFCLISITSSSIRSTLTIQRQLPLNGTKFTCLDETAILFVIASKMERYLKTLWQYSPY